MIRKVICFAIITLFIINSLLYAKTESGFTQQDRERLIRLETALKIFMEQTDKRFSDMNKRFADMNKRFVELREDMNKRFAELREDMNKRFEQVDKRFEQVDKRFEQVDKRFEQMMEFLWIIVGIFTTLTVSVIGFAYWDRRTIIRKAKEETIDEIEKDGRLRDFIKVLKQLALTDKKLAETMRSFGLL